MSELLKIYPQIEFHIVEEVTLNRSRLGFYPGVKVHGPVNNLKPIFINSICGICNVEIATGLQNKILNYEFGIQ